MNGTMKTYEENRIVVSNPGCGMSLTSIRAALMMARLGPPPVVYRIAKRAPGPVPAAVLQTLSAEPRRTQGTCPAAVGSRTVTRRR